MEVRRACTTRVNPSWRGVTEQHTSAADNLRGCSPSLAECLEEAPPHALIELLYARRLFWRHGTFNPGFGEPSLRRSARYGMYVRPTGTANTNSDPISADSRLTARCWLPRGHVLARGAAHQITLRASRLCVNTGLCVSSRADLSSQFCEPCVVIIRKLLPYKISYFCSTVQH